MITIPGYQIIKTIYESDNSLVYRALRNEDSHPIILKALKKGDPTPDEIVRYKQEYKTASSLNGGFFNGDQTNL